MKKIDHVILSGTKCSRRISSYLFFSVLLAFLAACDDSSSASAGQNDEPAVESSSSSSGKVTEPAEVTSSSSSVDSVSSSSLQGDKNSSSSGQNEASSSSLKSESSSSVGDSQSSSSEVVVNSSSSVSELSSSSLNGFDWSLPKEAYFNPDIDYGEMTDERDGKVYRTVKIGDQVWMAENLNYADSVTTPSLKKGKSWCYNNKVKNCDVAGRHYTWAAAMDSMKLATDADNPQDCDYGKECGLASAGSATLVQGICPSGWHLPSKAEWETLFTAVGGQSTAGQKLKSMIGWRAYSGITNEDAFGFFAMPDDDYFNYGGYSTYFWSSTEDDSKYAYCMHLYYSRDDADLYDSYKSNGFSVRCLKN